MKSRIAIAVLAVIVAVTSLCLGGCENNSETSDNSSSNSILSSEPESSESSSENDSSVSENSGSSSSSEASTPEVSKDEPTIFVGLDGETILSSEITSRKDTVKKPEDITEKDLWSSVVCNGFTYVREPTKIGYSNYKNPELFDDTEFLGDIPENNNEWKRVYVGDEICGLKVKTAAAGFKVNDYGYTFPAKYVDGFLSYCELEGTVEVEGYLQVTPRDVQYSEAGELVLFYPVGMNLPLTPPDHAEENGFADPFGVRTVYNHIDDFMYAGEFGDIHFGHFNDYDDLDGLQVGEVAYAKVTIGNIKCMLGTVIDATLEDVKLLSDALVHDSDKTEAHQPAPVL